MRGDLQSQRIGERFEGELRACIAAHEGIGDLPANRTREDNASASPSHHRQEFLRHGNVSEVIHLHDFSVCVERKEFHGPTDSDAGIVHEARKTLVSEHALQLLVNAVDRVQVGDVQHHGSQSRGAIDTQRCSIRLLAHPRKHPPSGAIQAQRGGAANAGRCAGDEYRA